VEFIAETADDPLRRLRDLVALMGDLGLPGSVVEMTAAGPQKALWDVRKAGLNIMMSMKGDGKPVSFIEDCAVPLEHLADYVDRLTQVFARHGTRGTWYAHASVGTLHVRPILDMRRDGAAKMRAIAEEASAMVREYKGAFSGEHGDGLVRSEWVAWQFGPRLTRAFERVREAGKKPRAVLVSGGGNDIAGDEFAMLINHVHSGLPALNATVADGVIRERLRTAMASLVGVVTRLSESHFGERARVVIHGYDYSIPDGRGWLGGGWFLPGPWLEPGFRRKGHVAEKPRQKESVLEANARVVRDLIDRYNAMLSALVRDLAAAGLSHVRYVDLRGTLSTALPSGYKADWGNELHPTKPGFAKVTVKIAAAL